MKEQYGALFGALGPRVLHPELQAIHCVVGAHVQAGPDGGVSQMEVLLKWR